MNGPKDQPEADRPAPDSNPEPGAQLELEPKAETGAMPFLEHLEELRKRLIKAFLAIIVCSGIAFGFREYIFEFIKIPLDGVPLHNMQVTGSFYAYLKISLFTGIMLALPFVFYHAWRFISPGLYSREKVMITPLVFISTVLFLIGAGFCYMIVLPIALQFLIGFAGEQIINYITVGSYISFAGLLLLAFGFGFQMPILAYFLGKFGLVSSRFLAKGRRYAFILILVVGAIITPPDVFTQVLLAVPLYLLYEISIIVVRVTGKRG
jgi:sec-independent protein translocase protein TatC